MRYHSKVLHHHHPVLHPTPAWLILMYLWDAPQEQNLYQATEVHSQDWVEFHYRKHHTALCTRAHDQTSLEVVSARSSSSSSIITRLSFAPSESVYTHFVYHYLCRVFILCVCTKPYWLFKPPSIWCVVLSQHDLCNFTQKLLCTGVCVCVYSALLYVCIVWSKSVKSDYIYKPKMKKYFDL